MVLAEAARPRSPIEVLTEAAADYLSGKPINKDATIGAAQDFFAQWSGGMGAAYRPDVMAGASEGSVHRRAQSGPSGPWNWGPFGPVPGMPQSGARASAGPPPHDPHAALARQIAAAREILGFAPRESLTEPMVKDRHRRLVRKYHPDHAPPSARAARTEKMKQINTARDVLLSALA